MTLQRSTALGDHPFELLFGALAFFGGLASTLGVIAPASINAVLPLLVVRAWGLLQASAGMLMVFGILLRYSTHSRLLTAWRLERAGLWPLAATAAVYAIVVLVYAGTRAIYPASTYLAVAVACVARARRVAHLERTVRGRGSSPDGD